MENKNREITIHSSAAEYLTYVASTGSNSDSFEMRYEDENIWLTQKMMATLYDVSVSAINQHLKRIFEDNELVEESVIKKYLITASDGKSYSTKHYNLQAIIAVGFKVNNDRAVRFRKWAGQIVKDYTIQGWTMDKERLKKGHMFTDEYFERQLENIREIRLSERKFYQKVTDLYATAFDYDKDAKTTRQFFKMVQNKMHWAVHRHTAAVLIFNAIKYLHIRNYYNLLNLFSCSFCLRGIIPSRHHYHPLTNRFGGNTDAQLPPKRKISGHGWEGEKSSKQMIERPPRYSHDCRYSLS